MSCPSGKIRYTSKKEASKRRQFVPGGGGLSTYKCNDCDGWHLGNKKTASGLKRKFRSEEREEFGVEA